MKLYMMKRVERRLSEKERGQVVEAQGRWFGLGNVSSAKGLHGCEGPPTECQGTPEHASRRNPLALADREV